MGASRIWLGMVVVAVAACSARAGDRGRPVFDDRPGSVDSGAVRPDAGTADSGAASVDAGVELGADARPEPGDVAGTGGTGGGRGLVEGSYDGRRYLLHVPFSYREDEPAPLVVALHGYGDDPDYYLGTLRAAGWVDVADERGAILMVPAPLNEVRPSFAHLSGDGRLMVEETRAELEGVLDAVYYGAGATHNVDTMRIYVSGFSEGAAVTELFALWMHDEVRAVAAYGGAVPDKGSRLMGDLRKIPVYMISGTEDNAYTTGAAEEALAEWVAAGHPTNHAWVEGVGHSFSTLNARGPSFGEVYEWMFTASTEDPRPSFER